MFVLYTNIKGRAWEPVPSLSNHPAVVPGIHAQDWVDMTLNEMYTYFGILICMALNPINDIEEYWSRTCGHFEYIVESMLCNRFQDIARAFSICNP
jgi:Transposase IS4